MQQLALPECFQYCRCCGWKCPLLFLPSPDICPLQKNIEKFVSFRTSDAECSVLMLCGSTIMLARYRHRTTQFLQEYRWEVFDCISYSDNLAPKHHLQLKKLLFCQCFVIIDRDEVVTRFTYCFLSHSMKQKHKKVRNCWWRIYGKVAQRSPYLFQKVFLFKSVFVFTYGPWKKLPSE